MYSGNMKRKVAKVAPLRLSPNEEALILKQEREKRRKLRLQQVREQEKFIAQQIRQDVRERRDQQLQHLAEELRAKWEADQAEKLRALEEVYLSALSAIGEGHRQAKENEPDLKAIERTQALNKEKAEKRHKEALQELKQHRQQQLTDQTWHIKARRKALEIEKERAVKVASLPPPPPDPLETLEIVKRTPLVKLCNVDSFSVSHYHLPEAYVDREMDTEQPDARTAAVEEAKRLDALQKEEERERREQMEKASLRGSYALKMVQLTQDRDKLMKELEQMQQEDFARRRQIVSQMPPQLFEPAYRRAEIREEWQKELESAFEDMYTKGTKMRGDMVLHLKPQPLPDPTVASIDEDLDLSVEPEAASETEPIFLGTERVSPRGEHQETREPQSRLVLRRLLNRIRTQKDQWSTKSDADTVSETLESGSLPMESAAQENKPDTKEAEDVTDNTVLAGNSILLHPQEQAARIRMENERKKGMEDLERQKVEQLEILRRLEEERRALEEEHFRVRQQMQAASRRDVEQDRSGAAEEEAAVPVVPETEPDTERAEPSVPASEAHVSSENLHVQMIREYQQRLLEQNRLHKQSVDEARKRLREYQLLLKKRYPHLSISRQETPDGGLQSPKPQALEYPPNVTASPFRNDSLKTSVTIKQSSEREQEANIPHTSGALESEQISPRNVRDPLPDPVLVDLKLSGDVLPQGDVDSNMLSNSIRNQDDISSSQTDFGEESSLQAILHQAPSPRESLHEDETRLLHAAAVYEKLSTTSSPGDYDTSSSTTYHPLPSELSLGLIDFPEPAIPLQVPRLRLVENQPLGDFSNVREFRERLLSSTMGIRAQQEHLKAMQDQLDQQRDSLLSKQKSQEDHLLQKQKQLEEQMRRHQESLENVLGSREPGENTLPADLCQIPKKERRHFISTLLEALDDSGQDDHTVGPGNDQSSGVIKLPVRDQRWRPSKPPVTKTKLGPFLEQHELSAIMEVETPTSGRRSSTGMAEGNVTGRSDVAKTAEVACHPETSPRELDLSGLSLASLERSSNESSNRSRTKLSWREMLSLDVSHDPSISDYSHSPAAPGFPADTRTESLCNPSTAQGAAAPGNAAHGWSPDGISDYLSTTTISTGSFLTSEKTDSSPASSDALSELQKCDYSVIGVPRDGSSSTSAATAVMQSNMRWHDYLTPVENQSHIQQIIAKYTKDLHASLERNLSFHSPEAAVDTSTADNNFPTTFYPLDPKPDFDASTPSLNAHSNPTSSSLCIMDVSQGSHGTSSQEAALQRNLLPALHNSADLRSSQSLGLCRNSPRSFAEAADSSGSFLPLHPESTLNEIHVSSQNETPYGTLALGLDGVNTDEPDGSLVSHVRSYDQSFISVNAGLNYTHASLAMEDPGSFHELVATKTTINDSEFSEHPISDIQDKNNSHADHFEELPLAPIELQREKDSGTAGHFLPDFTKQQSSVLPGQETTSGSDTALGSSDQTQGSVTTSGSDTALGSSDQTQGSERLSLGSHSGSSLNFLPSTIGSSVGSLPSCAYTWDSGSARGILEEPDLTLLSLNDSSIVCSEPTITQGVISAPQGHGNDSQHSFKQLSAEVDVSGFTLPDQSFLGGSLSQHFAEIDVEFTSTPGSLQEAFLKRKKHFIQNSSKRIQEIKTKDRVLKTPHLRSQPKDRSFSQGEQQHSFDRTLGEGSQLKKVVEVRVSTPECRKLSEIEMHQRTIRLYNQLDEVKTRKEEKMRQEAYARNREKAKDFKRRTLEKLRANKMK